MEKIQYDYTELKRKIKDSKKTQKEIAKALKIWPSTLSLKLNNRGNFYQDEILALIIILELEDSEVKTCFFTRKV